MSDKPSETEDLDTGKGIPLIIKAYGALCFVNGLVAMPAIALFFGKAIIDLVVRPEAVVIGMDLTLTFAIAAIGVILSVGSAGLLAFFGWSLMRNHRRNAARWASFLIVVTVVQLIIDVMLQGVGPYLIRPVIQLFILIFLSVTIDPELRRERELRRRLRDMQNREAAREGLLGRDLTGEGYIKLNFFNVFWVFVVCSVLGLMLEVVWHMVVVDPGVYQDRAGLLFGPFSPIYGFGALLMTVALNRFYDRGFLLIFLSSAFIGAAFEVATSWFMQKAFGAVAWDYPPVMFGGIPDPISMLCDGRTSTPFAIMWGFLGVIWIRFLLPRLLRIINLIPWQMRYSLTAVCSALMLVNGIMTLQSLDCWFERVSGIQPTSAVELFYAEHFGDQYMEDRFQSMTIHPEHSSRIGETSSS
ncbi:MAG: putative ABC transporter permease [Collinsella sp.]|nr:putative ABC transporter permease [Collinsella sp.]